MDLLNPITKKWLDGFLANPDTALLIHSEMNPLEGKEIAEKIYESLRERTSSPLYILDIGAKKSIGIDDVRDVKQYLLLSADKTTRYSRFVLVPEADLLTNEAQNALLKIIEELPKRTVFMLVVSDKSNILPTISSRCFGITVLPISKKQAQDYVTDDSYSRDQVARAYMLSEGNAGVFKSLLSNDLTELEKLISFSKKFIISSPFDRQRLISDLPKKEISNLDLLRSLQLLSRTAMRTSKSNESKQKWKNILKQSIETEKNLQANVNAKLAMLNLSVSI